MSRKRIIVGVAVSFAVLAAGYLWRDLHLTDEGRLAVPDVIIENMEINREFDNKKYRLSSPKVEHKDGVVYGDSMDIYVKDKTGRELSFFSQKGIYTRESDSIVLINSKGLLKQNDGAYFIKAGAASGDFKKEIWLFGDGIVLSHDKVNISAKAGSLDIKNEKCVLKGGAVVKWNER